MTTFKKTTMNKKTRTPQEFREAAIKHNIKLWPISKCSICGYITNYRFFRETGTLYFDSGCYCDYSPLRPSSWEEVAEHYNIQTNENVIAEYDNFWHFNDKDDD